MRWPANASAATCDMCSCASWLHRVTVRDALAEPNQRIDNQRRGGHADERQLGVVVEQQRGIADERQRLAREIADGFGYRALHLPDVVVDAREQLPGGAAGEEGRGLIEQVA